LSEASALCLPQAIFIPVVMYGVHACQHGTSRARIVHPPVPAIDPTTPGTLVHVRASSAGALNLPPTVFPAVVMDGIKTDYCVIRGASVVKVVIPTICPTRPVSTTCYSCAKATATEPPYAILPTVVVRGNQTRNDLPGAANVIHRGVPT
jgi:hypothetical protein